MSCWVRRKRYSEFRAVRQDAELKAVPGYEHRARSRGWCRWCLLLH